MQDDDAWERAEREKKLREAGRLNTFKWNKTDQKDQRQMDVWIGDNCIEFFFEKDMDGGYYVNLSSDIDYFEDYEYEDIVSNNMKEAMDSARKWIFKILREYVQHERKKYDEIKRVDEQIYWYLRKEMK